LTVLVVIVHVTALRENARLLPEAGSPRSDVAIMIQNSRVAITVVEADGTITDRTPSVQCVVPQLSLVTSNQSGRRRGNRCNNSG
jgi:hypothetical protein